MQNGRLAPGILVIEGDAGTLRRQPHLRAIDVIEQMLRSSVDLGQLRFRRLAIESERDIANARAWAPFFPNDGVIIVAHGSPESALIAREHPMNWGEIARSLSAVEPRVVMVVSCHGGLSTVAHQFFSSIPTLQLFLGSPTPVASVQSLAGMIDFLAEILGTRLSSAWSTAISIANGIVTGGTVYRRTRDQWHGNLPGEWVAQDAVAMLAKLSIEIFEFQPLLQRYFAFRRGQGDFVPCAE